jgi:hypothetical protein
MEVRGEMLDERPEGSVNLLLGDDMIIIQD